MAEYILKFHRPDTTVIDEMTLSVWVGNRYKSNEKALAIAATAYSALAYQDEDSMSALWLALGLTGLDGIESLIASYPDIDWKDCAATMDYLHAGRTKTAVWTLSYELGNKLTDDLSFMIDAGKTFDMAWK
jgi:hypothetical protein